MSDQATTPTELSIDVIKPNADNLRRKVKDGPRYKELVASVRSLGILEPLLVTHLGENGTYGLVAGHRRYEAAREVGLKTVPVHVRDLNEQQATEAMLIENLQRSDLLPVEEATGYTRLVGLGMSQKELAKRIGRSAAHVAERLKLLDLPPAIQKLVDLGDVPIGAAEHLLKLGSRQEIEALVKDNSRAILRTTDDYERAVRNRIEQRKREEQIVKAKELADKAGIPVLEVNAYSLPHNQKMREIGTDYDSLKVDPKAHASEPCHALVILTPRGEILKACTDPARHAAKGASDVKVPKGEKAGRTLSEYERKQRADAKEKKERKKARREAAATMLKGKLPAGAMEMALTTFVLDANMTQGKAVCDLLGVEVPKHQGYDAPTEALRKYMSGPANTTRAAAALAIVLMDDSFSESHPVAKHVGAWLKKAGVA